MKIKLENYIDIGFQQGVGLPTTGIDFYSSALGLSAKSMFAGVPIPFGHCAEVGLVCDRDLQCSALFIDRGFVGHIVDGLVYVDGLTDSLKKSIPSPRLGNARRPTLDASMWVGVFTHEIANYDARLFAVYNTDSPISVNAVKGDCRKCNAISHHAMIDYSGLCYECNTQGR